jgi:hypothetical protein
MARRIGQIEMPEFEMTKIALSNFGAHHHFDAKIAVVTPAHAPHKRSTAGRPVQRVLAVLIDREGNFSCDGTTHFRFGIADQQKTDLARMQLSLALAGAIQPRLPTLS